MRKRVALCTAEDRPLQDVRIGWTVVCVVLRYGTQGMTSVRLVLARARQPSLGVSDSSALRRKSQSRDVDAADETDDEDRHEHWQQ